MPSKEKLLPTLIDQIEGDVRADLMTQQIYSVDASIFEIPPQVVVLPKNREDLIRVVDIAREFDVPLTPRGGATGIAGGCLGSGIIVDTSKYLSKILEYNLSEKWIRCEPGVVQDQLNAFLVSHGLRLGPETSAGNRATVGGMCATNATGSHYLKYGNMRDHVLEIEIVFSDGSLGKLNEKSDLKHLPHPPSFPAFHRSSSGYPIETLLEKPRNLAKLTVGSEGTLGLFSSIKLNLSENIKKRSLALLPFSSVEKSLEAVPHILPFSPIAIEMIDHHVIKMGRLSPLLKGKLDWLKEIPSALLIVEFESDSPPSMAQNQQVILNPTIQNQVWALRKAGLVLLLSRRSYSRAIAFIEDMAVPPHQLAPFVRDLKQLLPWDVGIYGHAGDGCLHVRPYLNVTNPQEMETIFEMLPKVCDLVRKYGGVLSGEHGDGLIRSWLNPQLFDSPLYKAMVEVKKAFDPLNLMNPGKIVEGSSPQPYLRKSRPVKIESFLNFDKEGGWHLAADLCNGNGACRKQETLMCPSFHAFKDERDTTRARAQALRAIFNGNIPFQEMTKEGLLDVLDYCLECKGCKKECPSQIDMAKMKMEVLFQYQEKHGYSLRNRLFASLSSLAKYGSKLPTFTNRLMQSSLSKSLLSQVGIGRERPLPSLAKTPFSTWWRHRLPKKGSQKIHLFLDTFTQYYCPDVGISAVEFLEKMGYEVHLFATNICCGRPYLSKGMLKQAKKRALALNALLNKTETPVIVLEPSCQSAINDDYPSLIGSSHKTLSIEEVLPNLTLDEEVFYHPHCHEQALKEPSSLKSLFSKIQLSKAGCCGLAGSFGYETNHYAMSMAIGEHALFPQIRPLSENIPLLASGFSCRQQILHGTGKTALHPVQFLNLIKK